MDTISAREPAGPWHGGRAFKGHAPLGELVQAGCGRTAVPVQAHVVSPQRVDRDHDDLGRTWRLRRTACHRQQQASYGSTSPPNSSIRTPPPSLHISPTFEPTHCTAFPEIPTRCGRRKGSRAGYSHELDAARETRPGAPLPRPAKPLRWVLVEAAWHYPSRPVRTSPDRSRFSMNIRLVMWSQMCEFSCPSREKGDSSFRLQGTGV